MELDILSALLARPVSIYDLSARFPIGEIRRLERLGFISRVGDDYRISAAGKERIVRLSDQRVYASCNQSQRSANQKSKPDIVRLFRVAVSSVAGWLFTHISPADLFQKISELFRSLFH